MKITSREEWGAVNGRGAPLKVRPVPRVVIHHTYRPDLTSGLTEKTVRQHVRSIEVHHVRTNGWDAIGYNFLVDQDGRVYEGRGWGRVGAHAPGVNSKSVGIAFMIDGNEREPSEAAWHAVLELIRLGIRRSDIDSEYVVTGHRDHKDTDCPGDKVYSQLDRLRGLTGAATPPILIIDPDMAVPERKPPALDLQKIEVPRRAHVEEIVRVRGLDMGDAIPGLAVAEVLLRGVLAARKGGVDEVLKQAADALADAIKAR